MSFLARLTFLDNGEPEENYHIVLECSVEFNVATDRRGKRTENLKGGLIHVLLESTPKEDFLQWMKDPEENRAGEIVFYKREMMASAQKITFSMADCIHYSEEYIADGESPMKTRIVIAPFIISIGDTEVTLMEELKNV